MVNRGPCKIAEYDYIITNEIDGNYLSDIDCLEDLSDDDNDLD